MAEYTTYSTVYIDLVGGGDDDDDVTSYNVLVLGVKM
jgi:hypothetical protein